MQYSRLGNSGLVISRLAFGVMTFGHDEGKMGAVWKTGQEDANALVQRSLDAGINFFDTADGYAGGQSELMLGKALGARRKDIVLSTKIGFRTGPPITQSGSSMRHIVNSAELSQLNDNLGAANLALTPGEITELDAFTSPTPLYPNWFQTFATDAAMCWTQKRNREAIHGHNLYPPEHN
jgi:aryl-alcohol dehydrogenase-like predicted oxidoreductase